MYFKNPVLLLKCRVNVLSNMYKYIWNPAIQFTEWYERLKCSCSKVVIEIDLSHSTQKHSFTLKSHKSHKVIYYKQPCTAVIKIPTDACRSSVVLIRSSNLSPLSSTLLMLSFRITLTSLTWLCTWSNLGDWLYVGVWGLRSAYEKWK